MKQVVKASIGRWAFTLEQPAYDFLDAYLTQIKAQGHDLDTIEENLGSYFSTQVNNVSQVVTMQQIQQAIQDLGLPAFETFSSDAEHQSADENGKNKIEHCWVRITMTVIMFLLGRMGVCLGLIM